MCTSVTKYYSWVYPVSVSQAEYDTRPIFKQSTAGLNSEFYFPLTGYFNKALLSSPLGPGVVASDRALSIGQIELNCVLMLN